MKIYFVKLVIADKTYEIDVIEKEVKESAKSFLYKGDTMDTFDRNRRYDKDKLMVIDSYHVNSLPTIRLFWYIMCLFDQIEDAKSKLIEFANEYIDIIIDQADSFKKALNSRLMDE